MISDASTLVASTRKLKQKAKTKIDVNENSRMLFFLNEKVRKFIKKLFKLKNGLQPLSRSYTYHTYASVDSHKRFITIWVNMS